MTLALLLALVGVTLLLACAAGWFFLGKRFFTPIALLALLGFGLLAASVWLTVSHNSSTLSNLPTPSLGPTSTALSRSGQPPVILDVQTHKVSTAAGLFLSADISFQDPDGDAVTIAFNLVASTGIGVLPQPQPIEASPQEQIQGSSFNLEWECQGSTDMMLYKVIILDKAGHRSNLAPLLLDCS